MAAVTVLGDVNVEITGRIGERFADIHRNRLVYAPLGLAIGGTAANFALAAGGAFTKVRLLGAIGEDRLGELVERELREAGVDARLQRAPDLPTGLAVGIRDARPGGGTRLLMVRPASANCALDRAHLAANAPCLTDTDFLVADGYSMLGEPRRSAVLGALSAAACGGVHVVFDLVPHDCYRFADLDEVHGWLRDVHTAITEVDTIRRLLGLDRGDDGPGRTSLGRVLATLEPLTETLPGRNFFLRFGRDNANESLVFRPGRKPVHTFTGYSRTANLHAFGDRLTIRQMVKHLMEAP
ncbi:hypothetical protein KGA66_09810 [Actinocrinis puniceicyclus]|uniref:Carbohydrate kinase PfkB domain-containing protein n=1 Tax=Actinocrinis puniceicyclus TaxID=977794 RepID=A0A8J8BCA7_9ACTN|nr:PfkB family carbohydrate kinase [Actinocrinis puniceicyclus]MBS2963340.1 hypothetical protein [Actinocrinis puniceicyclus]